MCVSCKLGVYVDRDWAFSGIVTSIMHEAVENSECRKSMPETNQDKDESEQCRKVLSWDGDGCNWPEALRKGE